MNFHITYRPDTGIVRVLHYGPMSLVERMAAASMLAESYRHRSPLRILVDHRFAQSISPEEQRQFGRFLAEHPVLGAARIAVLHPCDRYPSQMVASEARSRGHDMRQFFVEAEAEAWLLQAKNEAMPSLAL
ncbi:hypothetical protein [Microbulbifer taiwanensis]|uniref:STAS/SEC14 domain-containing protein n=1 Tax=Microbulbifer taiwanensis TaxID=986746 RepID=A0ABW1YTH3_9GAMM|nr:hypothetical protein [Microbulbifer taiwanensis]